MTRRWLVVARLAQAGSLFAIPGIPLLLLVGLILFLVAVASSNISGSVAGHWPLVAIGWLSLLFVFAIIGVLACYWLPRIVLFRHGQGHYVPEIDLWRQLYLGVFPVVGLTVLITDGRGAPGWLLVLGVVPVALGLGAVIDTFQLGRRSTKREGGRRG